MPNTNARSGFPSHTPSHYDRLSIVLGLVGIILVWFLSRAAIVGTLALSEQLHGSVAAEQFTWASPSVIFRSLPPDSATHGLALVGSAPHDQTWTIECGSMLRLLVQVHRGYFVQSLPSSPTCLETGITLATDWSTVPGKSIGSRDERTLSFQLYEMRVGSNRIPLTSVVASASGLYEVEAIDLRNDPIGTLTRKGDAGWYKNIVTEGYRFDGDNSRQQNVAWPFLYPFLAKALAAGANMPPMEAMTDLNAALVLGALLLLFLLGLTMGLSLPAAMIAPAWLACNPFAFFLFGGFSEALFILLECTFVLLLIHRHYSLAACTVALLGATRFVGCLAVASLLYTLWRDGHLRGRLGWLKSAGISFAGFAGIAADIGIKWYQTDHPFAAFSVRSAWDVASMKEWVELIGLTRVSGGGYEPLLLFSLAVLVCCVAFALLAISADAHDRNMQITCVATLIVTATLALNPDLHSFGRYILPLAPTLVGILAAPLWQSRATPLLLIVTIGGALFVPFVTLRIANDLSPH